jgi:hypothetical protein
MRRILHISLLYIIIFGLTACKSTPSSAPQTELSQPEKAAQKTAPDGASQPPQPHHPSENPEEKSVYDLFVPKDQKRFSYNGYTLIKTVKKVWVKEERRDAPIEVPHSVLKRAGKTIKKFEFNDFSFTSPDFGWLNSSAHPAKHILVGQTEPRSGRFWVIRLAPYYRVLFDTNNFAGSRQELWVEDIDKDGMNELKVVTYGSISIGLSYNLLCTPQPLVIFKYDKRADRYLPANHLLESYALGGIEERIAQFQPAFEKLSFTDNQAMQECVDLRFFTELFLDFIYAGKEHEAWAFFDKYYNLPDRNTRKASIKADLRRDPIYRFIYRKRTKQHT